MDEPKVTKVPLQETVHSLTNAILGISSTLNSVSGTLSKLGASNLFPEEDLAKRQGILKELRDGYFEGDLHLPKLLEVITEMINSDSARLSEMNNL